MKKKLKHFLLVDDSKATNFFNRLIIEKSKLADRISIAENGAEALAYFDGTKDTNQVPDLVFLDINMPVMSGWEFMDRYNKLDCDNKNTIFILMIGADLMPEEQKRVKEYQFIKGESEKMLSKQFVYNLAQEHFIPSEIDIILDGI